ncbi:MAG TPA: glucosaminidase domain-containing protein [Bacteroidales bacterium]|nr:glucosaminidase domain-containing protein [Bacteroidales bacterium]
MKKIIFILSIILVSFRAFAPGPKPDPRADLENYLSGAPLTRGNLQLAFELNHIAAPAVVMAQSRLETGNYQSRLCLEVNNLFGMNFPRIRPTTSTGSTEFGFAIYRSWYDCVKDMKLFQEWYLSRGRDLTNYFEFLAAIGYAEDPEYIQKLTLLCTT